MNSDVPTHCYTTAYADYFRTNAFKTKKIYQVNASIDSKTEAMITIVRNTKWTKSTLIERGMNKHEHP